MALGPADRADHGAGLLDRASHRLGVLGAELGHAPQGEVDVPLRTDVLAGRESMAGSPRGRGAAAAVDGAPAALGAPAGLVKAPARGSRHYRRGWGGSSPSTPAPAPPRSVPERGNVGRTARGRCGRGASRAACPAGFHSVTAGAAGPSRRRVGDCASRPRGAVPASGAGRSSRWPRSVPRCGGSPPRTPRGRR